MKKRKILGTLTQSKNALRFHKIKKRRHLKTDIPVAEQISRRSEEITLTSNEPSVYFEEEFKQKLRQWQYGEWTALADTDLIKLRESPYRAKLAVLVAAGLHASGNASAAKQCVLMATDWGCTRQLISAILIAGVHNTIGRAYVLVQVKTSADRHFQSYQQIAQPFLDATGRASEGNKDNPTESNTSSDLTTDLKEGLFGITECQSSRKRSNEGDRNAFSSSEYWENRYKNGGNSGYGSYGRLAEFKAHILNGFIRNETIHSIIEFGCGDGNQLSQLIANKYTGIDISQSAIEICRSKFPEDESKTFYTNKEYANTGLTAELSLSLDVLFHLIENDVFESYMNLLFNASTRYCIIYSSNDDYRQDPSIHVRHRNFTEWVAKNINDWRLRQIIYNKYPHDGTNNPKNLSFSDFYIYEHI